jgi:hypothetical protein
VKALSGVGANLIGCVTNTPHPPRFRRKTIPEIRPAQEESAADPELADNEPVKSEHVGH